MLKNVVRVTPFYIKYKLEDEDDIYIVYFDSVDELFFNASKMIAFSDIEPVEVVKISYFDAECHFAGWHPGMRMIFLDNITGQTVWDSSYPQWDH